MKKKTKFIMVAMALCLTVALGVLGIFAVKTLNMTVGGNITFSADGISFVVSDGEFKTTTDAEYTGIMTETTKLQGFEMNTNTKLSNVQDKIDSWTNLNLTMSSLGDAVLHFTVTNKMESIPLYVVMTVSLGTNQNNNMDILVSPNKVAIPAGGTASQDYTITFDILDDTINASLTGFKIDIEITPTQPPAQGTQTSTGLKIPENANDFIQDGLVMKERPMVRVDTSYERPLLLRIEVSVSKQLKEQVEADSTKQFAIMVVVLSKFEVINPNRYASLDWVNEFRRTGASGCTLSKFTVSQLYLQEDGSYTYGYRLTGVPYSLMNLKIVAIGCIITTESDGTESFKYASFPEGEDYLSRAYSLGEAAHNALNERAKGNVAFTESQYQLIEDCANEYVDLVNGLENPTYDDSVFDFSINMGIPGIFQVGKEVDMQVKVSPNADVPITYVSSNTSVAIVDCAGILKTVGAGTATISVYVSGQVKTVTINVA